jgi:cysteine desulfurase / selenocysteine lyase
VSLDVARLRDDTPGCGGGLIHLNNAGAALMPRPVIEAVQAHLSREILEGGYEAQAAAHDATEGFYDAAARLIGARREEIAFTDSATRAWHAVFQAFDWRPGDEVLIARSEYASHMITFCHFERRFGIRPILAPDAADGEVDVRRLEKLISPRTRLICISHMPTNDGLINPVAEIGAVARCHGLPFLLDACQSIGQQPLDVSAIGCTMLTATGRKYLRGPRGSGFLWVSNAWADRLSPAVLDVQSATWSRRDRISVASGARRFELWERNVAGQIGLGVASDYAHRLGVAAIWERIRHLAAHLRSALAAIAGTTVWDQGVEHSGIVTFSHGGMAAAEIVERLRHRYRINTSLSSVQLTRTAIIDRGVEQLVRASVHAYNTVEELDQLAAALLELSRPGRGRRSARQDFRPLATGSQT